MLFLVVTILSWILSNGLYSKNHVLLSTKFETFDNANISPFPDVELKTLRDLYYNTDGQRWSWPANATKWNFIQSNPNPCFENWAGITCTSNCTNNVPCNVLNLYLVSYNMKGQLPSSIGNLSFLSLLDFYNNTIYGSIPASIGNLYNLRFFSLNKNLLEYQIPDSIGNLFNLNALLLAENSLSGSIPSTIEGLLNLNILNLENNFFSGPLPSKLSYSNSLEVLLLNGNFFNGSMHAITALTNLRFFVGANNYFSQQLPQEITNLTHLQYWSMSTNLITGSIPPSINLCSALAFLEMANNALTGKIPTSFGHISTLKYMYLYENFFTGSLPADISAWSQLITLDMHNNHLTGSLPPTLGMLHSLDYLDLSGNHLNGSLQTTHFYNLSSIITIKLTSNAFTSSIPESFYNLISLMDVDISSNRLTGTISPRIGQMIYLYYVYFNNNNMHGSIPNEITNITSLQNLYLSDNHFSGTIPQYLGVLTNLEYLILRNNSFHGTIPSSMGNLTSLQIFSVEFNQFSGSLPWSLWVPASHAWGWKNLNIFWAQNNYFTGNLNTMEFWRKLVDLNVSSNFFTGSIGNNIHRMVSMSSLDVSDNYLIGSLGTSLTRLTQLKVFSLAINQFSGNFNNVFFHINFTNIDISDNAFTGSLPEVIFQSNVLTTFAAVKNCISGALPTQSICTNPELETLALDGLYTANNCQNRFFPALPQLTSYELDINLPGGLPALSCLFNMSKLQTLHLSGNAITGTIPSDMVIGTSLQDLSLSYNQLSGSIPLIVQQKPNWLNLDLSFNKLNGVLDDTFAKPSNQTLIILNVNRLSGFIPSSLYDAEQIDILHGNLFNCDGSQSYRASLGTPSGVPVNDQYAAAYQCGSDDINSAMYLWISLTGLAVCTLLFIVVCSKYLPVNSSHKTFNEFVSSVLVIRQQMVDIIEVYRSDYTAKFHHRITAIYVLGKSMEVIRKMSLLIACYAVLMLLPAYCIVSIHNATHTFDYAWTASLGYLTGVLPAVVVLCLMIIFYCLFASSLNSFVLESSGLYSYEHKAVSTDSTNSQGTLKSIKLETSGNFMLFWTICFPASSDESSDTTDNNNSSWDWQSIWIGVQITCFNCIPVLIVNMCYVYLTTLNLSPTDMGFIVLTISLFKIAWNNLMVLGIFSDYMNQDHDASSSDDPSTRASNRHSVRFSFRMSRFSDVAKKVTKESIAKVQFLAHLTIFNNILAPCLADAFVDPDCFYYVVQPPPDVSASYSEVHCVDYLFSNQTVFCPTFGTDVHATSYNPPFIYSFQCSSAILNGFCTVFVYKYIISSIFVPIGKFILLRVEEQYARGDFPPIIQKVLSLFFGGGVAAVPSSSSGTEKTNEDISAPAFTMGENAIQMQHVEKYVSNRTTPSKQLGKEEEILRDGSESSIADTHQHTATERKIFNKEAFVVTLLGDLAVLVTFGLVFPPLALVILFGIIGNTFYHQIRIGNYVIAARKEREISSAVDDMPQPEMRNLPILALIRNTTTLQTTTTSTVAGNATWQDVLEKLRIECGDLMKLFWPAIPTLSILSAMFMGAFLFDILGDQEGALDALWILIVMSFVPVTIWVLEYLYLLMKKKFRTQEHQPTIPAPTESMNAFVENPVFQIRKLPTIPSPTNTIQQHQPSKSTKVEDGDANF